MHFFSALCMYCSLTHRQNVVLRLKWLNQLLACYFPTVVVVFPHHIFYRTHQTCISIEKNTSFFFITPCFVIEIEYTFILQSPKNDTKNTHDVKLACLQKSTGVSPCKRHLVNENVTHQLPRYSYIMVMYLSSSKRTPNL